MQTLPFWGTSHLTSRNRATGQQLPLFQVISYGLPGLPIAGASLPLFILVPPLYSQSFGMNLTLIASILIGVRIIDALSDPIIGVLSDKIETRWGLRKPWIAAGTPFLMISLYKVLVPPVEPTITYLLFWSIALTLSWTCLVLPYTAWGSELSTSYNERTRITSSREGSTVLGTLIIAAFPAILTSLGHTELTVHTKGIAIFVVVFLPITVVLALWATGPGIHKPHQSMPFKQSFSLVIQNRPFRTLVSCYFLNSLANAIPATLFIFYVSYILEQPHTYGYLLLLYFAAALVGIPFWFTLSTLIGKHRAWSIAMSIAIAAFVWTPFLRGPSDLPFFVGIVIFTGLTLGADLILPPAMQADVIDIDRERSNMERAGLFFALWGITTKMALGLSAGFALIVLSYVGFDPQLSEQGTQQTSRALLTLSVLYGLVPAFLKLLSVFLVRNYVEPLPIQ